MERLTKRIDAGVFRVCHYGHKDEMMCYGCIDRTRCNWDLLERLAAYEDTSLTPEDCAEYKKFEDEIIGTGSSIKRIVELMEAEQEGRLMVLPCKVGDPVNVPILLHAADGCYCKECRFRTNTGTCEHPRHVVLPTAYPYDFCSYGRRR